MPKLSFFHIKEYSTVNGRRRLKSVATGVYLLNWFDGTLNYAGTVWNLNKPGEFWVKKTHSQKALERFESDPVRLRFTPFPEYPAPGFYQHRRMEQFIRKKLFFIFGVHGSSKVDTPTESPSEQTTRISATQEWLNRNMEMIMDTELNPEEFQENQEFLERTDPNYSTFPYATASIIGLTLMYLYLSSVNWLLVYGTSNMLRD